MSKFHTTFSRREFMKGLGLAGAGLGVAAAVAPAFHDIDELTATANPQRHPWYVKERELEDPTVEIDWNVFQRVDRTRKVLGVTYPVTATRATDGPLNPKVAKTIQMKADGRDIQYMKALYPDYKGPTIRDYALTGATAASGGIGHPFTPTPNFLGVTTSVTIPTPESRNMTKWQGTPEENFLTLQNALRMYGASEVGVVELTEKTKRLIYLNNTSGKPYNFKDVDVAEDTKSEFAIPNKAKYVVTFSTLEASQTRCAPAPNWNGYDLYYRVINLAHYFIGALGYQHLEIAGASASDSFSAFSGLGEHSRASMVATHYRYGNMQRGMHRMITDMPLAPTKPFDAGIARFCVNCATCATMCPYESMPLGDKRWDHEDPEEEAAKNYTPGYKGWRLYNFRCPRCKNCHTTCPFNSFTNASVHDLVRITSTITPMFNGFFADMHEQFGFGTRHPEEFWDNPANTGVVDVELLKHR